MDCFVHKIHTYIGEVELCLSSYKQKLEDEKKEVENSKREISNLTNSFFEKDIDTDLKKIPMRISLPNRSLFDTIFKEDTQNGFILGEDHEKKQKRLAAERRAEYNAFLERKEQDSKLKLSVNEGMSNSTTPRSVLEFVDYETVLAKRKEEELKFRQLNNAESSITYDDLNNQKKADYSEKSHSSEHNNNTTRYQKNGDATYSEKSNVKIQNYSDSLSTSFQNINRPFSSQELHAHRTGGGGEPVKDHFGNLIIARGFKETAPILQLPSYNQDLSNKKSSYREELARQIEEKKHIAELKKQKAQELEDRIAKRIEEQRRQMQLEYEKELRTRDKVKEERQQERLRQLEEFQKKEAERRQKLRENQLKDYRVVEPKIPVSESVNENRSSSPPVPSVRSKVIFEKAFSPVLSTSKFLTEAPVKPENIFSSLAEIRKKIMQDQQHLKGLKGSYEVINRRTVHDDDDDDFDDGRISDHFENLKT